MCKRSAKSTQEENSQAKAEHATIPVWTQHFQKVLHPSHPEDLLSWNSVRYTLAAFTSTNPYVFDGGTS